MFSPKKIRPVDIILDGQFTIRSNFFYRYLLYNKVFVYVPDLELLPGVVVLVLVGPVLPELLPEGKGQNNNLYFLFDSLLFDFLV